jgi:cytochrome c-type biogenesis protein CcmH
MMRRTLLIALVLLGMALPALAVEPDETLADPALEARARAVSRDLRCMVCLNQSIDDSDAPLARDLRLIVRERITAGDSDAEVKAFLAARYGDYVLLRPRLSATTLALWAAPALALLAGLLIAARALARRPAAPAARLSPDEQRRLDDLMR